MAFLSKILKPHFTANGVQGIQGTSNSTQGVQGIQGIQGSAGLSNGTLITNTQSGSYTLQASDVGEVVSGVTTVSIPSNVFNPGENIVILNNDLSATILDIEGKNPAVSIYEAGVGVALTENRKIRNKSFISLFCTRLNEFILGGNLFKPFIEATGGTIIDSDGYRIHVFTGTGPFNVSFIGPPSYNTVEYVVVAGGGGVASLREGGGGAGGFRTGTGFPVTIQDYTITVGGGGPGVVNGNDSVFSTITSSGGGFGGAGNGNPGGSGGGGGIPGGSGGTGNTPPASPPQGNPGAPGTPVSPPSSMRGGGGGGAGGAGSAQNGGIGSPVTWVPGSYGTPGPAPGRYFAGGGGALTPGPITPTGLGGSGGGGNEGSPGTVNTGGGGGGNNGLGTSGGSGIVIIRYPII